MSNGLAVHHRPEKVGIDVYRVTVLGAISALTLVLGITSWLVADLIQQERKAIDLAGARAAQTAKDLGDITARVTAIEAARAQASKDADVVRGQILGKLDDLAREQVQTGKSVAALAATVETVEKLLDSQLRRLGMLTPGPLPR